MHKRLLGASLILALLCATGTGCTSARYKGSSFYHALPDSNEFCFGMKFKFSIDRPSEYHHPYETPIAMMGQPAAAALAE